MYTDIMRKAFHSIPAPKNFKVDVVDYDRFITLQFYESQWRHYSETERLLCITYLNKVKKTLEKIGAIVALDPIMDVKSPIIDK
jgi:hypothetical protein